MLRFVVLLSCVLMPAAASATIHYHGSISEQPAIFATRPVQPIDINIWIDVAGEQLSGKAIVSINDRMQQAAVTGTTDGERCTITAGNLLRFEGLCAGRGLAGKFTVGGRSMTAWLRGRGQRGEMVMGRLDWGLNGAETRVDGQCNVAEELATLGPAVLEPAQAARDAVARWRSEAAQMQAQRAGVARRAWEAAAAIKLSEQEFGLLMAPPPQPSRPPLGYPSFYQLPQPQRVDPWVQIRGNSARQQAINALPALRTDVRLLPREVDPAVSQAATQAILALGSALREAMAALPAEAASVPAAGDHLRAGERYADCQRLLNGPLDSPAGDLLPEAMAELKSRMAPAMPAYAEGLRPGTRETAQQFTLRLERIARNPLLAGEQGQQLLRAPIARLLTLRQAEADAAEKARLAQWAIDDARAAREAALAAAAQARADAAENARYRAIAGPAGAADGRAIAVLDGVRFDGRGLIADPERRARREAYLRTAQFPVGWPRFNAGWRLEPVDPKYPDWVEYRSTVSLRGLVTSSSGTTDTVDLSVGCRPGQSLSFYLPFTRIGASASSARSSDLLTVRIGAVEQRHYLSTGEADGTTDVVQYEDTPAGRRNERTLFSFDRWKPVYGTQIFFRRNPASLRPGDVSVAEALAAGKVTWSMGSLKLPINTTNPVWRRMITACR